METNFLASVVDLNVGGRHFTTSLATLTKYPDFKLANMFSGSYPAPKDKDGRYFIDIDGDDFAYVLQFLRFQKTPPPEKALDIHECAEYLGLTELMTALSDFMPVKAISLYGRVRTATHRIDSKLQAMKRDLFEHPILSGNAFITFKGERYPCDLSHTTHAFDTNCVNIVVRPDDSNESTTMALAAALIDGQYP